MGNNCTMSLIETMVSDGDADALECLLRQSPRVADRPVDLYGNTTAMVAARLGCYHLIPILVRFGCRLDARNYTGQSVVGILMNRISVLSRQDRESRDRVIHPVKGYREDSSATTTTTTTTLVSSGDSVAGSGGFDSGGGAGEGGEGRRRRGVGPVWKSTETDNRKIPEWSTGSVLPATGKWIDIKGKSSESKKRRLSHGSAADRECLQFVLRQLHGVSYGPKLINDTLNRNLDTALILAIDCRRHDLVPILLKAGCRVNQVNRDGHTALDLLVYHLFPIQTGSDHVQLWQKPSPGVVDDWSFDRLPKVFRILLSAGATGHSLGWFVLHIMSEEKLVGDLCQHFIGLAKDRLMGKLLLQTSVKYCQEKNLKFILRKGIDLQLYWEPVSSRTALHNVPVVTWEKVSTYAKKERMGALCEHVLESIKLPINAAILLIRAANSSNILHRIIEDLIRPIDPNLLTSLDDACHPRLTLSTELQTLRNLYNLDLSTHFRRRRRIESLQKLCKRCIRMHVARSTYYGIDRLPLPTRLREFLKANEH